jgi:hypothetical protein
VRVVLLAGLLEGKVKNNAETEQGEKQYVYRNRVWVTLSFLEKHLNSPFKGSLR